jgi:indolepyruvate ferredoxin oxidoreductase, beta subunit
MPNRKCTSVVVAGLGGQGVLRATSIVAKAAFDAGYDVKTSEVHGMSQRGGSVSSDVRFGERVDSPMVPAGEADYLVALSLDQLEPQRWLLGAHTVVVSPEQLDTSKLPNRRSLNIALVGLLSTLLPIDESFFTHAICESFPEDRRGPNLEAFALGRKARVAARGPAVASTPELSVKE